MSIDGAKTGNDMHGAENTESCRSGWLRVDLTKRMPGEVSTGASACPHAQE